MRAERRGPRARHTARARPRRHAPVPLPPAVGHPRNSALAFKPVLRVASFPCISRRTVDTTSPERVASAGADPAFRVLRAGLGVARTGENLHRAEDQTP